MAHFHNNALIGASGAGVTAYQIDRSLRFNRGDSAHLNRTPSSASNRRTWTWSGWIKRTSFGTRQHVFGAVSSGSSFSSFEFNADDELRFYDNTLGDSNAIVFETERVFRDPSAWYHIVVALDSTAGTDAARIKLYVNGVQETSFSTGPTVSSNGEGLTNSNNVRHNIGSWTPASSSLNLNAYLAECYFIDGSQVAASSFGELDSNLVWQPKEYSGTFGTNGFHLKFDDASSNAALGTDSSGNSNTWTVNNITAAAVASANTSQTWSSSSTGYHSGAGNAFDGNLTTSSFATSGANANAYVDIVPINASKVEVYISAYGSGSAGAYYYCRQTNGTQHTYTISSSGTSLGWITVYDGSQISINRLGGARNSSAAAGSAQYGWKVDGVLLVNTGTAGFDPTAIDSLVDSPTNYVADSGNNGGNYPTWNPFDNGGALVLSNGNLEAADTNNNQHRACRATQRIPNSGKWYFECTITTFSNTIAFGISTSVAVDPELATSGSRYLLVNTGGNVQRYDGSSYTEFNGQSGLGTGASLTSVLQVAVDQDAGKLWFGLNNVWLGTTTSAAGNPSNGTNPTLSGTYTDAFPVINCVNCAGAVNFGQRGFKYTPPTNFKSLCTQNFPNPPIADGSTAFDIDLYTGTNASLERSNFAFSPDFLWFKSRNAARTHVLIDTVRGRAKALESQSNGAEYTSDANRDLVSFDSDGFTVGQTQHFSSVNRSGDSIVVWGWDAGTSTVSNTDGSITSSVRANQTVGFSVVTATQGSGNSTWGHGLNAKPDWIIMKAREQTFGWYVSHSGLANQSTKFLNLHNTNAEQTNANWFASTEPTSSVVTTKAGGMWNSGDSFVAYCWTAVEGYSAFGSYLGNGSADGPFVYTGMRPKFILAKITSGNTDDWIVYDTERSSFNTADDELYPNQSSAEVSGSRPVDILSNGFKIRNTSNKWNGASGYGYVFAAFAEHPFKTARAR